MWLLHRLALTLYVLAQHCIAQSIDVETCSLGKVNNCEEFRQNVQNRIPNIGQKAILLDQSQLDHNTCYVLVDDFDLIYSKARDVCEDSNGMLPWLTNASLNSLEHTHMKQIMSQVRKTHFGMPYQGVRVALWLGLVGFKKRGWFWICPGNDTGSVRANQDDILWDIGQPNQEPNAFWLKFYPTMIGHRQNGQLHVELTMKQSQGYQFVCVAHSAVKWAPTSSTLSTPKPLPSVTVTAPAPATSIEMTLSTNSKRLSTNKAPDKTTEVIILAIIGLLSVLIIGSLICFEIKRRKTARDFSATARLEPGAFDEDEMAVRTEKVHTAEFKDQFFNDGSEFSAVPILEDTQLQSPRM